MPWFIADSLAIAIGERKYELIASRIGLQPRKGQGVLKGLGQVGSRLGTITQIDRKASGMF